jgi:hypothetical protein
MKAPVQQTELHFRPLTLIDSNSLAMVSSSSLRLKFITDYMKNKKTTTV